MALIITTSHRSVADEADAAARFLDEQLDSAGHVTVSLPTGTDESEQAEALALMLSADAVVFFALAQDARAYVADNPGLFAGKIVLPVIFDADAVGQRSAGSLPRIPGARTVLAAVDTQVDAFQRYRCGTAVVSAELADVLEAAAAALTTAVERTGAVS